jgi:prevent-host-death family protein
MVAYTKDEIMTATDIVRNFSSALNSVATKQMSKIVIVKNNRLEGVLISVEEYEKMREAVAVLERIYNKTKTSNGS